MKVLSICGGLETGYLALQELGISVEEYHTYELKNGDEFAISIDRNFSEVLSMMRLTTSRHMFYPMKVFKRVTWYKPRTWFQKYMIVKYAEFI